MTRQIPVVRHSPLRRMARALFPLIAAAVTVQPLAYAAPSPSLLSQEPMFVDVTVPANAALIVDDSLSMASGRLPLPPGVSAPSFWTSTPSSIASTYVGVMAGPDPTILGYQLFPPFDLTASVPITDWFYRAPSLNPQYYNPAITYTPWNNNGVRMPNAPIAMNPRSDGFRPGQTPHDMRFRGPNYTSSANLMRLNTSVGANAQTRTPANAVETATQIGNTSLSDTFGGTVDAGQNIDLFTKPMVRTSPVLTCTAYNTSFVYTTTTSSCSGGRVSLAPAPGTRWREEVDCTEAWGAWGSWGGAAPAIRYCPAATESGWREAWRASESPGASCPTGFTNVGGSPPCCPGANVTTASTSTPCSGTSGPLACPCSTTTVTGISGCPAGQTCPLANHWYTDPSRSPLARYYRFDFLGPPFDTFADILFRNALKPIFTYYRLIEIDRDVPTRKYLVVDADGFRSQRAPAAGEPTLPNHCMSQAPYDGTVCSFAEEAQNFANWYTYYRSRLFSAIAVTSEALARLTQANFGRDRVRLAYGSINYFPTGPDPYAPNPNQTRLPASLVVDNTAGAVNNVGILVRGVRPFLEGSADRQQVFNWLFSLRAIGATPNRETIDSVGRYFTRSDQLGPWADFPGVGGGRPASEHVPCRRTYALLVTDGEWTNGINVSPTAQSQPRLEDVPTGRPAVNPDVLGPQAASTVFNARSVAGPLLAGSGMQAGKTFQYSLASDPKWTVTGNPTGTLTDVALYYWSRDLRPDLVNNIPPMTTNAAFWQSMATYIVGFGISAPMDTPSFRTALSADWASLNWPAVVTTPGVITDSDTTPVNCATASATPAYGCGRRDDTFRAAMASRGNYLAATDIGALAASMASALATIVSITGSGSAPAMTRSRVESGDRVFVASFRTNEWFGELQSYDGIAYVDQLRSNGTLAAAPLWNASFPAWTARSIFTSTGAAAAGSSFVFSSLTAAQQTQVGSAAVVDYIRGNSERETAAAPFRRRNGRLLGDIVNSDPLFSKATDFGYNSARSPAAAAGNGGTYPAFVNANQKSRRGAVYVGANGGMLHAFDASTGEELFGYVPRAMLPQLQELTWVNYVHKYFVDGPVVHGDAFWSNQWRTVVVGTSGAGPKAVFALDVTNPAPTAENGRSAFGASNVLWDLTGADHADLGHITEPGFIASGKDGNWYYFVGNGWESQNDKATLLAINLQSGSVRSIATDAAGGTNGSLPTATSFLDRTNGLGGVTPVFDANRNVVAVYAGDRLGRLWKFDLSSTDPSAWKVATEDGKPLFEAINDNNERQAITAAPRLTLHPSGGNMIVFGTGKLYDRADKISQRVDSVYALWERPGNNVQIAANRNATSMVKLTLRDLPVPNGAPVGTRSDRVIDGEENVNWSTHLGWYFDLSTTAGEKGERLLSAPSDVSGFVQFSTFSPNNQGDPCVGGGSSYFYRLAVANNLSSTTPAFSAPRTPDVVGVPTLPTLEARMIARSPSSTTTTTSRTLTQAQLRAALDAAPAAGGGNCPSGTFSSIAGVPGMTPVGVTCLAPPLRSWRELPRGPR